MALNRLKIRLKRFFKYLGLGEGETTANVRRKAQPNNQQVASAWKELLQGAGLGAITNVPQKN